MIPLREQKILLHLVDFDLTFDVLLYKDSEFNSVLGVFPSFISVPVITYLDDKHLRREMVYSAHNCRLHHCREINAGIWAASYIPSQGQGENKYMYVYLFNSLFVLIHSPGQSLWSDAAHNRLSFPTSISICNEDSNPQKCSQANLR